jgi:tetratricopeptide (TPR) repeat protein
MADLDEALALDASQNVARGLRSQLRRKCGDFPGALADLDYLIEKEGPGSFWRTSRAMTYGEVGDFDRALREADDALRHAKSDFLSAQFHMIKARIHALAKDFDSAFTDLESAWLESDNCNVRLGVWLLRGSFYEKIDQLDKAIEAYRSCITEADIYLNKYRAGVRTQQITRLLAHGIIGELLSPSPRIGSHVAENYRQQAQQNIQRLSGSRQETRQP